MTKAKVGDYIKVNDHSDNESYYREGAGGKVVKVDDQCALVSFTHGEFDTANGSQWWIDHGKYTVEQPYSSTFTESDKAEAPQGHTADGGGLQKHSIGGLYPLCVVGYAHDADTTVFVVENLERGRIACGNRKVVRQWDSYKAAAAFAEHALFNTKDRGGDDIIWEPGRPIFEKRPLLVLNTAQG